ncbi:class I SAM-dependent methyltransferase [Mycolicibacterium sp. 120270]|uniref:class I SAM-dependent methyltransferase n=1 Tax=Mycolicibacterium sp. 120270 TaxID=3090600 RepID=UPI00299D1F57|nr:class I SAM-dependent methyltransferase [Mycolicibacterium sp. 120270]MDX1883978.1 class I SAM-dependent methyltransferase [Mycolicibacterium sp. 120270]
MTASATKIKLRGAARMIACWLWVGRATPSVLWQSIVGDIRYRLTQLGIPSRTAKDIAEVRAAFDAHAANGQFQERWFDVNIVPWCLTFPKVFSRTDPVRILEIGSWEGRSSLFFLTYFTKGSLTAVDTWLGGDEWEYNATDDLSDLEARFDGNVAPHAERLTKRKGSSLQVLPQMLNEDLKFDIIYVDGSHLADDVLTDAINAWRLLEQGGILIFDDVTAPFYLRMRANPAWAINSFLRYHKGSYKILQAGLQQVILEKTKEFADPLDTELAGLFQVSSGS